jgi:hypothetical protein
VPNATEWQHIGNQIDAALVFPRLNFVDVDETHGGWLQQLIRIGTTALV